MQPHARKHRTILPALLVLVALRALVPLGYMPAAVGSGLLFEVCHGGVPLSISASPSQTGGHHHGDGGSHHGGAHGDDGDHAMAADGCALGHILSLAFIDSFDSVDVTVVPPTSFDLPEPVARLLPSRRLTPAPRGPPLV